ncbi:hypothetical protein [Bradyrhizobium sp. 1(2017)]|jgi:hypothetical protein|uniref:hypothetical protein n=1 Tax=Bradyrhizobium sp. 1(2017) TaxID=1404888 RepID=UPI00140EC430|nr:hypothetical protein [Bradyrhizobium sp. 1(2017)]QIO34323.1 hypothetical protein HAP40_22265 [Bradyrhizobium sp. 1(2017)]
MPVTYTAEEAVNKAAAILGKYVPGEALGDVEHTVLDKSIDSVIAQIEKIVVIADRNAIPDLVFDTFARLVAIFAAAEFSNQPLDLLTVQQHEQRLRYLIAQMPTYEVLASNYF